MHKLINKYPEFFTIILLFLLCLMFLFFGLDLYPILDTSESLYVVISKSLLQHDNIKLLTVNMQPFLDNPPLYFWIIANSINLFETLNEFSVRLPNAIMSAILIFSTYYFGRRVVSLKFGLVSSVLFLTSIAFLLFSHIVILNIALTLFIALALYSGFLIDIVSDKLKKYYVYLFFIFCALAVLVKGLIGILLPVSIMFVYFLIINKLKAFFKSVHFLIGGIIFLAITMPWYLEMYHVFGIEFVKKYIYLPYISRIFFNMIDYIGLFFIGFLPWTFLFISYLFDCINKYVVRIKNNAKIKAITIEQKISLFGIVTFLLALLFICFMQKSDSLILLLLLPAAILTGYFLCADEINDNFRRKSIFISTYLLAIIFTVGTISFAFIYMFLPLEFFEKAHQFKNLLVIGINFLSILMLLKLKNKNIFTIISTYVFSMFFIIIFTIVHIFNMFYYSGEDELVKFSQYSSVKNARLVTYNIEIKPSVLINSQNKVNFIEKANFPELKKLLKSDKSIINFVIFKNKDSKKYKDEFEGLYLIEVGNKYSLYSSVKIPDKVLSRNKFYFEN